ncbi:transcriptional regulator [Jiella pacifica]|uniref:Transcriptional regulator n=1 Tax=Jiella pacifica TaxID=2696469 RepID=A0A6N9SY85_9HYPH|nr:transcriptional regulator [Jiella pacifica]NDW04044.1 transcriptional regulator [Jiella pacifica]
MTFLEKARTSWSPAPDWIEELALFADAQGLKGAALRTGVGGSTISQVLSKKYPGVLGNVEARVRGALMRETVDCPVLDEMRRDVCLNWQAKPFAATSSLRVSMFRACRSGCPHSKHTRGTDHE